MQCYFGILKKYIACLGRWFFYAYMLMNTFLKKRGAVKIWKPKVTPMSDLRPAQMNTIKTATGDEVQTMQKTSLTRENQPVSVQYVALSTKAFCYSYELFFRKLNIFSVLNNNAMLKSVEI